MSKRKHCAYTLEFKLKIVSEVEEKKLTKTEICKKHGIPNSTLSNFLRDRERLQKARDETKFRPTTKTMKLSNQEDLEEALFQWFQQARAMNVPVTGPVLIEKAAEVAPLLKDNFIPTPSWVEKFKQRRGIVFRVISGEAAAAPKEVANNWASDALQKILARYSPSDVYNADETGLFFQCLPDKTLALKDEVCTGGKKSKSRLTVMVATNMDGSHKLPPLVIGKSKNPRFFKHVKTLPVCYKSNRKAWMTSQLFEEWLKKLDRQFFAQNRKVAMVVDNCPAHPKIGDLKAVELIFLPPNTTSILQPCDQGIIKAFKQIYRKLLVRSYLLHVEDQMKGRKKDQVYKVDVLDALHRIKEAWSLVKQDCIANCFRHAGFVARDQEVESEGEAIQEENDVTDTDSFGNLFSRLSDMIPLSTTAEAYLAVDEGLATSEVLTTEEIVNSIAEKDDEEEDDEEMPPPPPPTVAEARDAMKTLRQFIESQPAANLQLDMASNLQDYLEKVAVSKVRQTSITSFFKRV